MANITLPPDLERFAAEAVAAGRYRDRSKLVRGVVSLLSRGEKAPVARRGLLAGPATGVTRRRKFVP